MKAFTYVLIVLFIFSVGIGNERLLKVTAEYSYCTATLPHVVCKLSPPCNALCRDTYGILADGDCIANKCVCEYPGPCHKF
ncbi:hypothetical protein HN51_067147 [Arachis hypogaea]|nr:uncharacterized protein DS421_14g473840 [Arachis hypogaea]